MAIVKAAARLILREQPNYKYRDPVLCFGVPDVYVDEADLPPLAWYDVLAVLRDAPDQRLRQVEIAERVLLSNSGLSRLLDRIVARGLVERISCESDRRAFFVCLTDEGRDMLEKMWPVYARGVAEDFLPALGENPCEIRQTLESIGEQCEVARAANETAAAGD